MIAGAFVKTELVCPSCLATMFVSNGDPWVQCCVTPGCKHAGKKVRVAPTVMKVEELE